jgi:hypothetical protein
MSMLDELCTEENLHRAWRWLCSNPDSVYKQYFRQLYEIYAVADIRILRRLQDRLSRRIYEPSPACKLFFPKSSGFLRPYSLLTVDDQIVYQAAVNLVAERLCPRVERLYHKEVFGHLYAGKESTWFYQDWKKGYAEFNEAARSAFSDGFRVAASFDLTACYDSLDHGVLRHMLVQIGCKDDFCETLTKWLSVWTATDRRIYHNHGIPQGPLSSGLLSEVVLRHFDDAPRRKWRVRYSRYVDDIRLFAKSEQDLRRALVRLDRLTKDVGLFPQTSKISIHVVGDIEDELKTVSHPPEPSIRRRVVDQKRLTGRLIELTPRFHVADATRFKYLLCHAEPNFKITSRLWRIFERQPEFYAPIGLYLSRYRKFPKQVGLRVIREIERQELYGAIRDALLRAAERRLSSRQAIRLGTLIKQEIWRQRDLSADLFASAGRFLIEAGRLTPAQTEYAFRSDRPWWGRSQLVLALSPMNASGAMLETILNDSLRDRNSDVAISAAYTIAKSGVAIASPRRKLNPNAAEVLHEFGLIRRTPPPPCGIEASFRRMVGNTPHINWKNVFRHNYREVERHVIYLRALADTNVSAWVNAMDVFNDWLLDALYAHDRSMGRYILGSVGSVLHGGRLGKKYPAVHALVENVHNKRLESPLSHAKTKKTGRPTRPIRYKYLRPAKGLIRGAIVELSAKW